VPIDNKSTAGIDWSLTTWEGSRREQLRRWAALPLEQIIASIVHLEQLGERLARATAIVSEMPRPVLPVSNGDLVREPLPRDRTPKK
jgi:hypothetical protein